MTKTEIRSREWLLDRFAGSEGQPSDEQETVLNSEPGTEFAVTWPEHAVTRQHIGDASSIRATKQ